MKKLNAIVCGRINTNCYILQNEKNECLIFDIPDSSGEKVAEFCKKNNLNPLAVFLTHGHFDHCGGFAAFEKSFPVELYGHIRDKEKTETASNNRFRIKAENCAIGIFLTDAQIVKLSDFSVSVIHTPGHSGGSVCYIVDNFMFSGDTLFHGEIGRTDLTDGNPNEMHESLKKLRALKENFDVYPGHEESSTLNEEKLNNPYMRF